MEGVETIVVGEGYVGVVVQKESKHVVAFLRYGVVQRGIAFGVLQRNFK